MIADALIALGIVAVLAICAGFALRLFVAAIAREFWR